MKLKLQSENWQIFFHLEITAGSCSDSQPAYQTGSKLSSVGKNVALTCAHDSKKTCCSNSQFFPCKCHHNAPKARHDCASCSCKMLVPFCSVSSVVAQCAMMKNFLSEHPKPAKARSSTWARILNSHDKLRSDAKLTQPSDFL